MAITDVDVANVSLDLLKETAITSFDDDRVTGRWMKRNYAIVRDMVLAANPWRFAVERVELPEASVAPIFGYQHKYAKPTDSLRILPLRYLGEKNGRLIEHSVEGGFILTNASAPLRVRYIKRVVDATLFSPLFIDAFTLNMAVRLTSLLTGKAAVLTELKNSYKEAMTQAMFVDSAEGTSENTTGSVYDDVRYFENNRYY
jgi:hypothetical protein